MGIAQATTPARRRDKWTGLAIIVLTFGGCMGLSIWGMNVSTPRPAPTPEPVSTDNLPGFPSEVRPFDLVERAENLSVRRKFRGFVVHGVRADGTVDLTNPKHSIRYSFQSDSGRGPQPDREPGTLPTRRYCGVQHVAVDKNGIVAKPDNPRRTCGSRPIEDLSEPAECSIEDIWKLARKKKKFSRKKPARLEFFVSSSGATYRISQDKHTMVILARDCRSELKGRAGRGSIP